MLTCIVSHVRSLEVNLGQHRDQASTLTEQHSKCALIISNPSKRVIKVEYCESFGHCSGA